MCATERQGTATRRRGSRPGRAGGQRGLSLVELMVGMMVALLVGLGAAVSAAGFTASQRQGVGSAAGGANAHLAAAVIRNDIAAAGLGFFADSRFACSQLNLSVGSRVVIDGAAFAPVQITAGLGANDRLDVVYATDVASAAGVRLGAASTGGTAQLRSLLPVAIGQAVLLGPDSAAAARPCTVRSVTAVQSATGTEPLRLTFSATGLHNQAAFTSPATYADLDRVSVLGTLRWSRYRLEGTRLLVEQPLGAGNGGPMTSEVLLRDVVGFRVQYGVAAAPGSRALQAWQDASGEFANLDANRIARLRALRVGVLVRSAQREKPDERGTCRASPELPVLFGSPVQPNVTDWQCFRYRAAEVVIPLRNFAMGLTPTTASPTVPLP